MLEKALQFPDQNIWIYIIKVEVDGLFYNKTFKDKPLSEGQQPIIAKFVFDVKYKEDRTILKYKARFVVKDFIQIYKIDYEETFALNTGSYKAYIELGIWKKKSEAKDWQPKEKTMQSK